MAIKYRLPERWLKYDPRALLNELSEAKGAVMSLKSIPYRRSWAEALQQVQLKHEIAGTSKIEGADFTERELDAALRSETPEATMTRSQKQASAAVATYRWIARLPDDRPIDANLIREVHRRIVTGCDDDHCPPGELRKHDQNVVFGTPRHRGVEGGKECEKAFALLRDAVQGEFRSHDLLIQALALHYHVGAMHPFLDGNGRTARALEALVLQRAGLRDEVFIAMSNYYYDEKSQYLKSLSEGAADGHDLTVFLAFGLNGIATQCRRLLSEIRRHVDKALFRDLMYDLFNRLRGPKKRVIAKRQLTILNKMLDVEIIAYGELYESMRPAYQSLKNPVRAFIRDLTYLLNLGAIEAIETDDKKFTLAVRLNWATEITETEFFERMSELPQAKTYKFLQQ